MAGWILPKEWITIFFSVVCALMAIAPTSYGQTVEPVCEWKTPATGPEVCFVTLTDTTVSQHDTRAACPEHGHAAYLARFPDRTSFDDAMLLKSSSVDAQYWTSLQYGKWGDGSADTWTGLSGCGYVAGSGVIQSGLCSKELTGYICQRAEEHVCTWTATSGDDVCFVTLNRSSVSQDVASSACRTHSDKAYLAIFPDQASYDEVMGLNLTSAGAQYWTSLYYWFGWRWGDYSADMWTGLSSTSGCGYANENGVIQSQDCASQLKGYICQRPEQHVCTWTATSGDDVCFVTLTRSTVSRDVAKSECIAHGDGAYLARFPDKASYDEVMGLNLTSVAAQYWTSLYHDKKWLWGDGSADTWTGLSDAFSQCGYVDASGGIKSQSCTKQLTGYICQRAAASPALAMTTSEPTTSLDIMTSEPMTSQDTLTSGPTTSKNTLTSEPTTSLEITTSDQTTSQDTMKSKPMTSQDTMTSGPTTSKAGMTASENTADSSAKPTGDVAPTSETPNQASNTTAPHTEGPRGNGTSNSTADPADPNGNTSNTTADPEDPNGNTSNTTADPENPNGNTSNTTADPEDPDGKGTSNTTMDPAAGCQDLSPCHPACKNGGVCVNGACYCPDGFTGKKCHKEVHGLAKQNNNVTTCEPCRCLKPAANASRYYCSQCGDPPVLPHTSVYMSTCGETVRYACLPGFLRLRGNATKKCDQERGEWPTWNNLVCRNASAEEQKVEIFVPKEELTEDEQFQAKIGWTAADSRPAAIGLGSVVGITFVGILVVAVVVMDALSLAEHVRGCRQNLRGQQPRKVKTAKVAPRK